MAKRSSREEPPRTTSWQDLPVDPPCIYANHAQVIVRAWDITLRLGQLNFNLADGEAAQATELVRAFMSPQTCKAVAKLLTRQVASYEEQFGKIHDIGD